MLEAKNVNFAYMRGQPVINDLDSFASKMENLLLF